MAKIEIGRKHALGKAQARIAVEQVAGELEASLGARHQWQQDALKFECPGAHGAINVSDEEVRVVVDLAWVLTPAKGKIEREIEAYLTRYLG